MKIARTAKVVRPAVEFRTVMDLRAEVENRRTFAIISHPDAGKTTLTEKLLLYGGAIVTAGQVAARRRARSATSDWMSLERERGISITSTVLQFPYGGYTLNLLDTPGHQDFGEDTYRTLLAADSAVMLIDAAKGVEPQTRKLFAICRARRIPLFTFINKMDRPTRDPLELLDELENVLGIGAYPVNWPLGGGETFRGVYDRETHEVHTFERTEHGAKRAPLSVAGVHDEKIRALVDEGTYREFLDGIELLEGAGAAFDHAAMMRGDVTPVFFGSAMTNFGVELFLDRFVKMGPPPGARLDANGTAVEPADDHFSAFVFKIQANMDPRHRDRVAFARICSGKFERDMTVHNARSGKDVRLTRAMKLFANERESIDVAYAGDVVGLANPGTFAIGDTLADFARRALRSDSGLRTGTFRAGAQYRYRKLQVVSEGDRTVARRGCHSSALSVRTNADRTYPRGRRRPPVRGREVTPRVGLQRQDADDDPAVRARAQRNRRSRSDRRSAVAVQRAAGRRLGRPSDRVVRERVEHAARR